MIITKNEAICLVLKFAKNNIVSSPTKLNKLLARLNLHFIPVDINFSLNKYGSYHAELGEISSNSYFTVQPYTTLSGTSTKKFILTTEGVRFFSEDIQKKLNTIFTNDDFQALQEEIFELSTLKADEISDNEHKKLLVDVKDRVELEQNLNATFCDMLDIFEQLPKIAEDSLAAMSLKALIEYCFYLMKYIKDMRFKQIPEDYDYDAYMFDYYFLYNIREIVPFLNEQIKQKKKNEKKINKYYQYFVNSVQENNYPFSLENKNLDKLVAA